MYKHLFGPVPSRRLGLSLGVDMLSGRTCTFDCVFCELGKTRDLTVDRGEYVKHDEILGELAEWVSAGGQADYITLAGRGEPTLNTGFGDVIRGIRSITETPVALLSNGSLFSLKDVREDAALADLVKISLSAWNQESLSKLNRPCPCLNFDEIVESYIEFRKSFDGELWLEVVVVDGVNSHADAIAHIAELARSIKPDRIQMNTVVRPGTERSLLPVSSERLEVLAKLFEPDAEVIGGFNGDSTSSVDIRQILSRRPCTIQDLKKVTGMTEDKLELLIGERSADWHIESDTRDDGVYYFVGSERG